MKNMIYVIIIFLMLFMMLLKIILREESLVVETSMFTKTPLLMLKVLKLFLFHLPMHATLCFFDLFSYKFPRHRKWVRLKCVSYFLFDFLFCFNSYSLVRASSIIFKPS